MNINKEIETCGWGQFVAIEIADSKTNKFRFCKKHVNILENIDESNERDDLIDDNKIQVSHHDRAVSLDIKCNTYFGLICFTILYVPYWLCFK